LGIPAIADKVLQMAVTKILEAIYEADFLPCSYGYRPGRGALDAVRDLSRTLQNGEYHFVVEADIQGFFDHIDHDQLLAILAERIDDRPFPGLIRRWLQAGILETDGRVIKPEEGTPQGGIVSPVLANVYLHRVLDQWFEEEVKSCPVEARSISADMLTILWRHSNTKRMPNASMKPWENGSVNTV
jgi:group II intron reverse transcriptase/maturase